MSQRLGEGEPPCTHCGLPLPAGARGFCCSGCFMAHHLLGREVEGEGRRSDGMLARLVLSAFLALGVMMFSLSLYGIDGEMHDDTALAMRGLFRMGALALSLPVFLLLGVPLFDAVVALRRWFSADALILLGMTAALLVSAWNTLQDGTFVFFETATMVLVLVSAGRWLDARARERAHEHVMMLANASSRPALRVERGVETETKEEELRVGDLVRIRAGETIPVDGVVVQGHSFIDQSHLTGEAAPRSVTPDDRVLAGTLAVDGTLLVRATAVFGSRVRDGIERMLAESIGKRARIVRLSDRLAGALLPLVTTLAVGTALWHWEAAGPEQALLHALTVLLIACPCALGLATPLAFWVALGEAWRRGILVQGGEVLERVARTRRVFFDKTGTLTSGALELLSIDVIEAAGVSAEEALSIAAALERGSAHPVARSLRKAQGDSRSVLAATADALGDLQVDDFRTLPGIGVEGRINGSSYTLRRAQHGAQEQPDSPITRVALERDADVVATFDLLAEVRPEARAVIRDLARRGLEPSGLTGDAPGPAAALEEWLAMPIESELLPDAKAARIRAAGPVGTLFVGDGLNDMVALAAADVGVAVSGSSARSLEIASVNLLRDDLHLVPELLDLAQRAVQTARTNLAWAFSYNVVGLWFAVSGRLTPVFAATAMVLSSIAVVLNSCRLRGATGDVARPQANRMLHEQGSMLPVRE